MKQAILAAVALVLGVLLGGLGPRAQLQELQQQSKDAANKPCSAGVGHDLAGMLGGGLDRERAVDNAKAQPDPPVAGNDTPAPEHRHRRFWGRRADDGNTDASPPADANKPQDIDAMREALELRRTQSRAALVEQASPSDEQLAKFDQTVDDMNTQLDDMAQDFIDKYGQGDRQPTRREAMGFASDALDILTQTEDNLTSTLTPEQRQAIDDEAVDPFSYVDPKLLDKLQQIDKTALPGGGPP